MALPHQGRLAVRHRAATPRRRTKWRHRCGPGLRRPPPPPGPPPHAVATRHLSPTGSPTRPSWLAARQPTRPAPHLEAPPPHAPPQLRRVSARRMTRRPTPHPVHPPCRAPRPLSRRSPNRRLMLLCTCRLPRQLPAPCRSRRPHSSPSNRLRPPRHPALSRRRRRSSGCSPTTPKPALLLDRKSHRSRERPGRRPLGAPPGCARPGCGCCESTRGR